MIVLCQGGIVPGRSLEDISACAGPLKNSGACTVFLGSGDREYMARLARIARKSGGGNNFYIGKSVPPDRVLEYTACADLGIISNRGRGLNNTAGGPNRLFEYIQARIPILSYSHAGVESVLKLTGTGWTVKWNNPAELAGMITGKLREKNGISAEAFENAARLFCWESEGKKLTGLVDSI